LSKKTIVKIGAGREVSSLVQLKNLWRHLTNRRKCQLFILIALTILVSFAEVLSIGAVLPFLGVLTAPERLFQFESTIVIVHLLGITRPSDLIFPATLFFIIASVIAGIARIILLWAQVRLSMGIGLDFSVQVYERTLYQPYPVHISRNSSEIITGSQKANQLVGTVILPILTVTGSTVIFLSIVVALIAIDPLIAGCALLGIILIYVHVALITKPRMIENSRIVANRQSLATKIMQEGLGGIRDVIIDGTQRFYSNMYRDAYRSMQAALSNNNVWSASPRFAVEALGMVLIAGLAYFITVTVDDRESANSAIPLLGAMALGAQRILPLLQQIYSAYVSLKGNQSNIEDALGLLNQPLGIGLTNTVGDPMNFERSIELRDVSFRYKADTDWILKNLSLEIPKGSRVGLIGVSGGGKSTLLDMIMGLLHPTQGNLVIDGSRVAADRVWAWQKHISHVPQAVYIADVSIAENIAFGVPVDQINMSRVRDSARSAQIAETIERFPDGYGAVVGERGVKLSGGQRQRIGIARALYKQTSILVLDEATSALDTETEARFLESVRLLGRDITIIMAAHRLTTLNTCDFILELSGGSVRKIKDNRQLTQN
jgi:ABC-type multidrug transport system fused ATPase/permease subunit